MPTAAWPKVRPGILPVADVFTFSNGLIVRMQAYSDPAQAFAKYS